MKSAMWIGACVGALTCQLALALDGPNRPQSTHKSTPAAAGHAKAKASSFAPGPHVKHASYGAPVGQPILKTRKPVHKTPHLNATPLPAKPGG